MTSFAKNVASSLNRVRKNALPDLLRLVDGFAIADDAAIERSLLALPGPPALSAARHVACASRATIRMRL